MSNQNITLEEIIKTYKNNYSSILHEFISVQSDFLSDIYKRYNKDLDAANIVLYFARNLHGKTLRERDKDLDFNISFEKFWENHEKTKQDNRKIIDIAQSTGLPKETARRKVNNLIRTKVLQKNRNYIFWSPPQHDKESYNSVVDRQINQISKLVQNISVYLNIKISKDKISNELKKHFSFFWFHYLSTQLKYLKMWQKELNDLELILIGLQCVIQTNLDFKKNNVKFEDHFFSSKSNQIKIKQNDNFSVSATSVSEVTGVPRATCIRKLDKLNKMKIIKKNMNSKRFQIDLKNFQNNLLNSKKISQNTIEMFSEFYLIVLKALNRRE
tara:strand:- start:2384 stop:3367 length:984 start_codon:yes stop_codon:yes gene_type:complete